MSVPVLSATPTLDDLKKLKNSVIGNPLAKRRIVQDERAVRTLVDYLNPPSAVQHEPGIASMRIEAANIVSSLAYGSDDALGVLLRNDAPRALLFAISNFTPQDPVSLHSAFARALKTVAGAVADVVGPPLYGISSVERSIILVEAKQALSRFFTADSLDIYLPLLSHQSTSYSPVIPTSIAQFIATSVHSAEHRKAIVEWVPPDQRHRHRRPSGVGQDDNTTMPKSNRGWEKPSVTAASGAGSSGGAIVDPIVIATGGWAVRVLVGLLSARETKLQEASLEALASLARDNPVVALVLAKQLPSPLSVVHSLIRSRNLDVQLSACLCATRILRTCGISYNDDACIKSVLSIILRILDGEREPIGQVIKTCYILYFLIMDDRKLTELAFERGCLYKVARILVDITPATITEGWDENEAEGVSKLREASLTALAAFCFFDTDIRRALTDNTDVLPRVSVSLTCTYPGVRYAACQVVRMLARGVSVLRTNIVDSGLGMSVWEIFKRGFSDPPSAASVTDKEKVAEDKKQEVEKQREDRRVIAAALKAVCNIVVDFSPLRPIFMTQGIMHRLMQLIHPEDPTEVSHTLRSDALWTVKNMLWKSTTETKRDIMNQFGWRNLYEFLHDSHEDIQEQAYHIIRNIAETEEGITLVFRELCPLPSSPSLSASPSLTPPSLLDSIATLFLTSTSPNAVVVQATFVLANLADGHARDTQAIVHHPRLLEALRTVIADRANDVRRPAVACILHLVMEREGGRERRRAMVNRGVGETLRRVCEWAPMAMSAAGGSGHGSNARRMSHGSMMGGTAIGNYLHPSDRIGVSTSPTNTRMGHQRNATGTFAVGASPSTVAASPTSPTSPGGAPTYHLHPHSHYSSHATLGHGPTLHHHPTSLHHQAPTYPYVSASAPMVSPLHLGPSSTAGVYGAYTSSNTPGQPMYTMMGAYSPLAPVSSTSASPGASAGLSGYPASSGTSLGPVGVGRIGGASGGSGSAGSEAGSHSHSAMEIDKEVYERARRALDWLEHGEGYAL